MSHSYEISITVSEHDNDKRAHIIEAVAALGYEAEVTNDGPEHASAGDIFFAHEHINVGGERTDEEIASEVWEAIWAANGSCCEVNVNLRDLDIEVPCYSADEDEYDKWLARLNIESNG